jgi:hypothetical protein
MKCAGFLREHYRLIIMYVLRIFRVLIMLDTMYGNLLFISFLHTMLEAVRSIELQDSLKVSHSVVWQILRINHLDIRRAP